ncbi:MAG: hypothetical protein U0802_21275, partial [Candidatus Binatia bacterium]
PSRDDFTVGAVIVSRNDDYGGDLCERATYALGSAMATFDKVLYVDWGSPSTDLLHEIRHRLPAVGALSMVRIAPDHAAQLVRHDPGAQRCCEVLGRNIGIRRLADQGFDYLVSSNIDIVFPGKERLRAFVRERLAPNRLITVARRDVGLDDVRSIAADDPLAVSSALHERRESYTQMRRCVSDPFSLIIACGDFQIAPRRVWEVVRGFEERLIYRLLGDTGLQAKAVAAGFEVEADFELPVFHIAHGGGSGGRGKRNRSWRMLPPLRITRNPPTWGCSDDPRLQETVVR